MKTKLFLLPTKNERLREEISKDIGFVLSILQAVTSLVILLQKNDQLAITLREREYNLKLKLGQLKRELYDIEQLLNIKKD